MTLKLDGVEKVLAALKDVQNEVVTKVDAELEASANKMVAKAKDKAPFNFGQLKNSIGSEKESRLRYVIFANAYHAPYIEFGTRGKVKVPSELQDVAQKVKSRPKRGSYDDMIDNIFEWLKKKGGSSTQIVRVNSGKRMGQYRKASALSQAIALREEAKRIAFWVSIKGIAPQPFLWPSFLEVKPKLISRLQTLLKGIQL